MMCYELPLGVLFLGTEVDKCGFLCQFGEAMRFMLDNAAGMEYLAVRKL